MVSLGGPCHPWLFIEESAAKEVGKDFNSVYSRLVLCKTFRLDEDGKVLTPEEVSQLKLYKQLLSTFLHIVYWNFNDNMSILLYNTIIFLCFQF